MDAKHKDALRELEIAALRGHPDGYATSDCTVTYKEAADALRAALARYDEADRMETLIRELTGLSYADYMAVKAAVAEAYDG